jgi:hypothetical protein
MQDWPPEWLADLARHPMQFKAAIKDLTEDERRLISDDKIEKAIEWLGEDKKAARSFLETTNLNTTTLRRR